MPAQRDLFGAGRHGKCPLVVRGGGLGTRYLYPPGGGGGHGVNQSEEVPAQFFGEASDVRTDCDRRSLDGDEPLAGAGSACHFVRNALDLRGFYRLERGSLHPARGANATRTLISPTCRKTVMHAHVDEVACRE